MDRNQMALRASWIGFAGNLTLALFKVIGGLIGRSSALLADGLNSSSDVATDLVAIWGFRSVEKPLDADHSYGHGKFETLASAAVGVSLVLVAAGIFWDALSTARDIFRGVTNEPPELWVLAIAVMTILAKLFLYRYTAAVARATDSDVMWGKAWDHRSDVLASLCTIVGVAGALWFGHWGRLLDPLAGLAVSVLVAWEGLRIVRGATEELSEAALPVEVQARIENCIRSTPGVHGVHHLRCRRLGSYYAMDFHILVEPEISVRSGHEIATATELRLMDRFGSATLVTVHMEPDEPKKRKYAH